MKVGIVGMGYVGLTLGIASSLKGIKVFGIEKNPSILEKLSKGEPHFYEPGIQNHLAGCLNNELFIGAELPKDESFDAFIITVGTPLIKGSKEPNYDYLKSAIDMIADNYQAHQVIILRSTVSVGTSKKVVLPYLSEKLGLPEDEINLAFCPERTIEGNAINELYSLPQIIGANSDTAYDLAESYFRKITPYIIGVDTLEAAELVKLFNNTYRDIHFAIGNAFNEIAQSFGLDGYDIISASNQGYKRSNIAMPGYVGGPCLEKDPYILAVNMPEIDGKNFVLNARNFNESLEDIVVSWVEEKVKLSDVSKKIGISGLAFKGVPDTSDLRGSNAVNIARKLKALGYELELHDYLADYDELVEMNIGSINESLESLIENNYLTLIMNNNPRYKEVRISGLGKSSKLILDSWNVMEYRNLADSKVDVKTLGNFLV